ncbi:Ig-like domain-containing protein [Alloalcanivorax marinus]|uniref:Ig-like domain-containing protein n=1 Tax=Alloalcanivorax marinus TaxID=1177169 RepID=UPI00195CC07A|nr:Ig-like domain-containing protein [Alloalcanivorax marinus]MBM7334185.1 Ig-like domain-containing protein [Alloalcanivorax marinus]
MTIRILNRTVAALSAAVILSACGGGGDSAEGRASDPSAQSQGLVYAFPGDGQTEVSTASPVILRFTSSVNVGDAMNGITLYEGGADGRAMSPEFEPVQGQPNNLMLVPEEDDPFKPNQQYTLVIEDLPLGGNGTAENRTLQFTTRALHEGPKELVVTDMDDFRITGAFPNFDNDNLGGEQRFQAMDFSSFRFQMSQPVDRATAVYGESVTLTYGPDDTEVPATLLVDGRYLTVDPEPEYLDPSQTYELTLTGDLASTYGANFTERSLRFKPQDTSPRGEPTRLVQRLTVNEPSKLTGRDVNTVPVNGTLLGEDENVTQARADSVIAELGDATVFSRTTPIRLPKGTILKGDAINPILIGGKVPAGFGSGEVTMTLLSDATGYLVQNRYMEDGENVSRMIQLMMDVGIATAEPRANGAFTQDLLHIELVGLADIDTSAGVLNVDAVSVVEPDILGQEYGYGLLSFQLQSYEDQTNAPQQSEDATAPSIQSWTVGNYEDSRTADSLSKGYLYRLGDPVVINFDEPIEVAKDANIYFYENGSEIEFDAYVDGAALVLQPRENLSASKESNPVDYEIQIVSGVSDVAGNNWSGSFSENFSLPYVVETAIKEYNDSGAPLNQVQSVRKHSPIVLSVYPGFPCALDPSTTDLQSGTMGRCLGSFPGWQQGGQFDIKDEDDYLPIMDMPADRPIVVQFSKPIDPNSVSLGGTFSVNKLDGQGNVTDAVAGTLSLRGRTLTFTPEKNWEEGTLYSYTLSSADVAGGVSVDCTGAEAVCDTEGLPLQTNLFADLTISAYANPSTQDKLYYFKVDAKDYTAGGPDMTQYFEGSAHTNAVLQVLKNAPSYDTNANFVHENHLDVQPEDGSPLLLQQPGYALYDFLDESQEQGADAQPLDENADQSLDPNGVIPPLNSAKTLSRQPLPDFDPSTVVTVNGSSFGCGYSEAEYINPQNPFAGARITATQECPSQKFTYINGALTAEVTDEYVSGQGLKVKIWPAQIMSTSVPIFTQFDEFPYIIESASGAQVLRMRYEEDLNGNRTQPITGWLKDENGTLTLSAEVDLYMDGIDLVRYFQVNDPSHSLMSQPITMQLSGGVRFLDDGRMVIEQYNLNPVDVDVRIWGSSGTLAGLIPLRIPEFGSRLQYVSESIK